MRILGVTRELGELHFFVERPGLVEPVLVPKREAYKQFPDLCLNYFESKLIWRRTLYPAGEIVNKCISKTSCI